MNFGTADNLFRALKDSLAKYDMDFSKAIAFMSKHNKCYERGKIGCSKAYQARKSDVGCICHLADLCVKAGMATLPVDIDQLFIDVYYYFQHSSKRNKGFVDIWHCFYANEPKVLFKHCKTQWLSLLRCI